MTETQANNVAEQIINFAGKVWQLQQDAKVIDISPVTIESEEKTLALPAASN